MKSPFKHRDSLQVSLLGEPVTFSTVAWPWHWGNGIDFIKEANVTQFAKAWMPRIVVVGGGWFSRLAAQSGFLNPLCARALLVPRMRAHR